VNVLVGTLGIGDELLLVGSGISCLQEKANTSINARNAVYIRLLNGIIKSKKVQKVLNQTTIHYILLIDLTFFSRITPKIA